MSEKNLCENEDPSWTIHMQMLTKRKRSLQIAQTIDEAINEYYTLHELPVPKWRINRDPQWWTDYLISLGLDPKNP